ncbi:fumarylacetoacetate hydrolase family protein [Ahrensia sp. R2A130]|uniref:fumarylacetoacetate hydrolase family protein n=1 Tax=Ahrensia sp. R2A130 TaxID=744979 RepID=UPI0001E0BCDD|nr:fumarylacetoacetate hydrolase family protein [Ahrensia sp. R2A130]EFL87721.1 fumarylacetoacetate hydrolase domain-containing protein 2A [Ahrensia sp. R2A130]
MRLVAFEGADGPHVGVVSDGGVIDVTAIDENAPRDIQTAIENGRIGEYAAAADNAGDDRLNYDALTFLLPVERPGKILCLGLNYMEHVNEGIFEKQPYPTIFMRSVSSMVPHGQPMVCPSKSIQLDYEAELALVIGKHAKHLTAENALDVVAGYTCCNDGSVREYQRHTIQWTMGKNFDATGPLGPVFVTPDELPEAAKGLKIECRLNGQTVQSSNTDMMMFPVVETLVYLTEGLTLEPGDIVLMGTRSGVGHARKPPLWMKDGDVVEVEIEKVGLLRNRIVDEVSA